MVYTEQRDLNGNLESVIGPRGESFSPNSDSPAARDYQAWLASGGQVTPDPRHNLDAFRPLAVAELKARGVAALDGAGYLPFKQIQMLLVLLAATIKSHADFVRVVKAYNVNLSVDTTALESAAASIPALTELTLGKVLALAGEIATARGQLNAIEEQIADPAATVESIRAALTTIPTPRKASDVEASA